MSVWTVTIYGANTKPAQSPVDGFVTKASLDAMVTAGTAKKFTYYPLGLYPEMKNEYEKTAYIGGYKTSDKTITIGLSLKDTIQDYPSSATSLNNVYPIEVLNKAYTWINIPSDYNYYPNELTGYTVGDYCMEVIPVGGGTDKQDSTKQITIEFEKAYNE